MNETRYPPMIIMGVQGSGKSTIGKALAERLNIDFIDGDDLHPKANKEKMAVGAPEGAMGLAGGITRVSLGSGIDSSPVSSSSR